MSCRVRGTAQRDDQDDERGGQKDGESTHTRRNGGKMIREWTDG